MKTLQVTERELVELRRALEMANDMMNDNVLDPLYIQPGKTKEFSSDEMRAIREEVEENMDSLIALRSLLGKIDVRLNEKGYSV